MTARQNPRFVRNTRRIGTEGRVVAANLQNTNSLTFFLRQDVTEHAALFIVIIITSGGKHVKGPPRPKRSSRQLRRGMLELLSRTCALILENADVFETAVALQI